MHLIAQGICKWWSEHLRRPPWGMIDIVHDASHGFSAPRYGNSPPDISNRTNSKGDILKRAVPWIRQEVRMAESQRSVGTRLNSSITSRQEVMMKINAS